MKFTLRAAKRLAIMASSVVASVLVMGPAVQAQNTLPSSGKSSFQLIDAADMGPLLAELGIQSQVQESSTGAKIVRAQTQAGANFFISFLGCEDESMAVGCKSLIYRAAMSNSGVTYDDLNQYNRTAIVVKAINLPENNLIGFLRHAIVVGGVGKVQLQTQLALFLNDMDTYVKTQSQATSVSYQGDGAFTQSQNANNDTNIDEKTAGLLLSNSSKIVDASQPSAPVWLTGLGNESSMLESAIFNTYSVRFMTDQARTLLD